MLSSLCRLARFLRQLRALLFSKMTSFEVRLWGACATCTPSSHALGPPPPVQRKASSDALVALSVLVSIWKRYADWGVGVVVGVDVGTLLHRW